LSRQCYQPLPPLLLLLLLLLRSEAKQRQDTHQFSHQ